MAGNCSAVSPVSPNEPSRARRSDTVRSTLSSMCSRAQRPGSSCSCSCAKYPSATLWPTSTTPWVGACTAARQRSRLLLPAPLRPITTTRSPRPTVKSMSRRTFFGPYDTCTPRTVSGRAPERAGVGRRKRVLRSRLISSVRLSFMRSTLRSRTLALRARSSVLARMESASELSLRIWRSSRARFFSRLLDVGGQLRTERRVVALELPQAALGQVQDLGDDPVEQLQVVADDEHRPRKARQLAHEPSLGGEVEMVGRLVEHEDVGLPEQHPDDVDAPALATGQGVDVVEEDVLAQPDPLGETGDLTFEVVPPGGPVALLEVGEGGDGIGGRVRRHRAPGLVQLLVEHVEASGREHVGEPRGFEPETTGPRHLGQESEGSLRGDVPPHPKV